MRLVIFGPQGAGKGTQAARIAEKWGIPAISTGEIFRWAIKGRTALGNEVLQYVNAGRLVPDERGSGIHHRVDQEEGQDRLDDQGRLGLDPELAQQRPRALAASLHPQLIRIDCYVSLLGGLVRVGDG